MYKLVLSTVGVIPLFDLGLTRVYGIFPDSLCLVVSRAIVACSLAVFRLACRRDRQVK